MDGLFNIYVPSITENWTAECAQDSALDSNDTSFGSQLWASSSLSAAPLTYPEQEGMDEGYDPQSPEMDSRLDSQSSTTSSEFRRRLDEEYRRFGSLESSQPQAELLPTGHSVHHTPSTNVSPESSQGSDISSSRTDYSIQETGDSMNVDMPSICQHPQTDPRESLVRNDSHMDVDTNSSHSFLEAPSPAMAHDPPDAFQNYLQGREQHQYEYPGEGNEEGGSLAGTRKNKPRFKCANPECGAGYSTNTTLIRHYMTSSKPDCHALFPGEPVVFSCEICGAILSRSDSLKRHVRRQHDLQTKQMTTRVSSRSAPGV